MGGQDEYDVIKAVKSGRIDKPGRLEELRENFAIMLWGIELKID